jgi:hypothetical protein
VRRTAEASSPEATSPGSSLDEHPGLRRRTPSASVRNGCAQSTWGSCGSGALFAIGFVAAGLVTGAGAPSAAVTATGFAVARRAGAAGFASARLEAAGFTSEPGGGARFTSALTAGAAPGPGARAGAGDGSLLCALPATTSGGGAGFAFVGSTIVCSDSELGRASSMISGETVGPCATGVAGAGTGCSSEPALPVALVLSAGSSSAAPLTGARLSVPTPSGGRLIFASSAQPATKKTGMLSSPATMPRLRADQPRVSRRERAALPLSGQVYTAACGSGGSSTSASSSRGARAAGACPGAASCRARDGAVSTTAHT